MPPVFDQNCTNCGICIEDCPGNVMSPGEETPEVTYPEECWHCGVCRMSCPCDAISYKFPLSLLI